MKDDLELQMNDDLKNLEDIKRSLEDEFEGKVNDDDRTYSTRRKRIGSSHNKSLRILLIILPILIFAEGVIYFLTKGLTGDEADLLKFKMSTLEQKTAMLEKQLGELQGKIRTSGPDPTLLQRVDALDKKIEELEKQKQPIPESKAKLSAPPNRAASNKKRYNSDKKQYHTVQKGENLYRISEKYGISLEELRKLNNLSVDQPLHTGQKLLVSPQP